MARVDSGVEDSLSRRHSAIMHAPNHPAKWHESVRAILLACALCFFAGTASSQPFGERTWVGPPGGLWSSPQNWSPAGAPDPLDTLVFPAAVSGQHSVNDLQIVVWRMQIFATPYRITGTLLRVGFLGLSSCGDVLLDLDVEFAGRNAGISSCSESAQYLRPTVVRGMFTASTDLLLGNMNLEGGLDTRSHRVEINGIVSGPIFGRGQIAERVFSPDRYAFELRGSGGFSGSVLGRVRLTGVQLPNASVNTIDVAGYGEVRSLTTEYLRLEGGTLSAFQASLKGETDFVLGRTGTLLGNLRISDRATIQSTARLNLVAETGAQVARGGSVPLISNLSQPVTGVFPNAPDGTVLWINDHALTVNYRGGFSRRDVTLSRASGTLPSSLLIESDPAVPIAGRPAILRARVLGNNNPTGTVTFYNGSPIGTAPIVNGVAQMSTTFPNGNGLLIKAVYSGDTVLSGGVFERAIASETLLTVLPWERQIPSGTVGQLYPEQQFTAAGGVPPYQFRIEVPEALPRGLTMTTDGRLVGTPMEEGFFGIPIAVTDSVGNRTETGYDIEVKPAPEPKSISVQLIGMPRLVSGMYLVNSGPRVIGSGGRVPYRVTSVSPMPPGLTLTESGEIFGAPEPAGFYPARVRVEDADGVVAFFNLDLLVADSPTPKSSQTIQFAATNLVFLVGDQVTLWAAATSQLQITYSTTSTSCSVVGEQAIFHSPGPCTIIANQIGNSAYLPAAPVSLTLTPSTTARRVTGLTCRPGVRSITCDFVPLPPGGAPILDYALRCLSFSAPEFQIGSSSGPRPPLTVSNIGFLSAPYRCEVSARTTAGNDPWVTAEGLIPLPSTARPVPPSITRAIVLPGGSVDVGISGVVGPGSLPWTRYGVVWDDGSSTRVAMCQTQCGNITINVDPFVGSTLTLYAIGINDAGVSDWSAPYRLTYPSESVPFNGAIPLAQRGGAIGFTRASILLGANDGKTLFWGGWSGPAITFSPRQDAFPPGNEFVAAGDFDGDGASDWAYRNIASGDPALVTVKPINTGYPNRLRSVKRAWIAQAVADVDGDGTSDIVFRYTGLDGRPEDTGVSYVWFMKDNKVQQVRKRGGAPLDWKLLGAYDINGDFAADMVYVSPRNEVRVLLATPNRTCANYAAGALPPGFSALKLADFQGGGTASILARDAAGNTILYALDGKTLMPPAPTADPDDPNASCTPTDAIVSTSIINLPNSSGLSYYFGGDLDGNGFPDIVWRNTDGSLQVWFMRTNTAAPMIAPNMGRPPENTVVLQP